MTGLNCNETISGQETSMFGGCSSQPACADTDHAPPASWSIFFCSGSPHSYYFRSRPGFAISCRKNNSVEQNKTYLANAISCNSLPPTTSQPAPMWFASLGGIGCICIFAMFTKSASRCKEPVGYRSSCTRNRHLIYRTNLCLVTQVEDYPNKPRPFE